MKVIGLDCWTKGARHYQRLLPAFTEIGAEFLLIHLGSWGDEKGRPDEEFFDGMRMRDIEYYAGRRIPEILEEEKPDAVIFTSLDAFAHRAFNRYCRQRGIPTLHLFHGLQQLMEIPYRSSAVRRLWLMRRHIPKLLFRFLPVYVRSLYETGGSAEDWRQLIVDLLLRGRGRRSIVAGLDSTATAACVYIEADREPAISKYRHDSTAVHVVGNPDIVGFEISDCQLGASIRCAEELDDVMYIDTALVEYGFVFRTVEEYIAHVHGTNVSLVALGKRLVFKPHPSQSRHIVDKIRMMGIDVCDSQSFVSRLSRCFACISEPSTASLVPALLGLPLLLANYGPLREQRYSEFLLNYPRASLLVDVADTQRLVAEISRRCDNAEVRHWIAAAAGPLPASDMPRRVVSVIESLVD